MIQASSAAVRSALPTIAIAAAGRLVDAPRHARALVDGLALHAVLAPEVTTPERQVELLEAYLSAT